MSKSGDDMSAKDSQTLRFPGEWRIEYGYTIGREAAAFFDGIRRHEMLGSRCDACQQVAVPPKSFCERCFVKVTDLVPVELVGTIAAATVVTQGFEGSPPVPYSVAYATLDGATSATANYVRDVPMGEEISALPPELAPGRRVAVQFADEPQGRLSDFWFVPLSEDA
jgi:uncharacterized OB-fold protein